MERCIVKNEKGGVYITTLDEFYEDETLELIMVETIETNDLNEYLKEETEE